MVAMSLVLTAIAGKEHTNAAVTVPVEEAQLRYAEQRKTLLAAAHYVLPELVEVEHEALLRYPEREA